MSDILEEIQELSNKFSNLFEVDDLGQPAMDVPPSQNKIKRDRKTKDGKVELVSVEDELFPYEGNKREQYRQKILDTINNMIQGKATLEDLLQIVRQKKAPLKEAMELMEDLFSTILKQPDEKQGSLVYKYHQAKNKENAGKDTYTQAKEEEKRKSKEEKGQEKTEQRKKYRGKSVEDWKLGRLMDQIARNAKNLGKVEDSATAKAIRRNAQKANLQEALEIMEAIEKYIDNDGNTHELEFSANKNKYKFDHKINGKSVVSAVDSEPNANYERKHAVKNYDLKKVEEALEIMEAIINEVSDKTAQSALDAAQQRYNRKGYEASMKLFRGDSKGAIEDGNKAQDEYNKHLNLQLKRAKRLGKKLVQDKNDHDSFKIEEALSLMEAIINEVSVGALVRAVENNLPKRKKNEEAAIKAYKQAQNEYEKGSKESPEDEPALYKKLQCTDKAACKEFDKARDAENLKDLNLPKDSKVSANKLFNAAKKVNPERQKKTEETVKNTKGTKEDAKKFLNSLKRDNRSFDISLADPVKSRNEALEEALAVINEVSKEFLKDKDNKAKVKVLKAIIRHGETITPENPKGDTELLKIRQDSIDRLKKYREKCKDYLEKKEKRNDK